MTTDEIDDLRAENERLRIENDQLQTDLLSGCGEVLDRYWRKNRNQAEQIQACWNEIRDLKYRLAQAETERK